MVITQQELLNILHYNLYNGLWTWKCSGNIAGTLNEDGYIIININHKLYRAHRLAWLYVEGEWPDFDIDHEDIIKHNNAWNNLRGADKSKNGANRSKPSNNTSGVKGVYWDKQTKMWRAKIKVRGKHISLGRYFIKEKAVEAYKIAALKYFNEFARTE